MWRPEAGIKLFCCAGAKSGPVLLEHFLRHYRALGVEHFLIALHAEPSDPRADAMRERLAEQGIRPALEVAEFSGPRKLRYLKQVLAERCRPEDWVVHADLDELQVYPAPLPELLAECDARGRRYVRGRLADRLAPGGELAELRPRPSLWEQFPLTAPVSRVVCGAWDRKVCAAKAGVPLADGGSHALDHGAGPLRNYELTHAGGEAEGGVEIHHFKWDAGLPRRLREKLECRGGDRDAVDGRHFMREYRALAEHLARHGRIAVEGARFAGTPQLHGAPRYAPASPETAAPPPRAVEPTNRQA